MYDAAVFQFLRKFMFSEPQWARENHAGWIEVICGPMFSGKTEELLRRLRRAKIADIPLAIFKPEVDERYGQYRIVSHDANYFPSMPLHESRDILRFRGEARLVAIDEAQFFDNKLPQVTEELALAGVRVIVAGLDMDYQGKPFGSMPEIMAMAEFITKLSAICVQCGALATHSFRKSQGTGQILLGEKDLYEPRCRYCFHSKTEV